MAGTGEGKREEADYKRLHNFPLIRVWRGAEGGNKSQRYFMTRTGQPYSKSCHFSK